jgi:hypothetical protein
VAPVGSNAFEFYFSVLQIEPGNAAAMAALRDLFKPACADVEHSIAAGDLDEAQRELQLLRAYDAGNYRYDPAATTSLPCSADTSMPSARCWAASTRWKPPRWRPAMRMRRSKAAQPAR